MGAECHVCGHDMYDECGWCELTADRDRLLAAVTRAHEQLSKHDYKGPKQITRALVTLEAAIPALEGLQTSPEETP